MATLQCHPALAAEKSIFSKCDQNNAISAGSTTYETLRLSSTNIPVFERLRAILHPDEARCSGLRAVEDCARVVEFLATNLSDYVTDVVILVDGGWNEGNARTSPVSMLVRKDALTTWKIDP